MPDRIANAPVLQVGLELYLNAFLDLSSCRPQGFVEGPISWISIHQYAEANEFTGEQREDLFYYIHSLDNEYLKFKNRKTKGSSSNRGISQKQDG